MALHYDDFIGHDADIIFDAYTARHGHPPGPSDLAHFLFKRAAGNEVNITQVGWTLRQVLEDIANAPTDNPNPVPFPIPEDGHGPINPGFIVPLTISNEMFHAGDAVWPWKMVTAFQLYDKYLRGEDIGAFLMWAQLVGANGVRVLGMAHNLFRLYPQERGIVYGQNIAPFCQLVASYGLYIEWVIFADAQEVMNSSNVQRFFFDAMIEQLRQQPNVVVELVNEYSQNGVLPNTFNQPGGILISRGSGLSGEFPPYVPWTHVTYHTQRKAEWVRTSKDSHEIREGTGSYLAKRCPVAPNESIGAGDTLIPWSRSNVPDDFYWYAATAQLMGAGATFHFQNGLFADLPSLMQQLCAESFFSGISSVPPEAQKWHYTAGHLSDCPLEHSDTKALRTFAKLNGDQAEAIVIRPTAEWRPVAKNGWTLGKQQGPLGSRVSLTR